MIGMVNAHMFGRESEPGERVHWSRPDVDTRQGWYGILGMTVEEYAESSPHMIVFETGCVCARHDDGSVTTFLCPVHADADPCQTMAAVTGRRRVGTIRRDTCSNCGWTS